MKFENALKYMRKGKRIQIPSGNFGFFLKEKISKAGIKDLCLYRFYRDTRTKEIHKYQRIRELNVHYITMFDWELVNETEQSNE
ncbi:MAG: hypothetical protein J6C85_02295 [Alphaproteobacteria bacterium]|nr:hypothetical protein [Alphaproteobacteria bacterium]